MRNWFKKVLTNESERSSHSTIEKLESEELIEMEEPESAWHRLKKGLQKTRQNMASGLAAFFKKNQTLTEEDWDELETVLLSADFGLKTTQDIIRHLQQLTKKQKEMDGELLKNHLADYLVSLLEPIHAEFKLKAKHQPHVILMVGVNGVGKTTSLAKLAAYFKQDKRVMMAAGDTFRAAAIEQLQKWGHHQNIPVIAQTSGSDSAAVIFDALQAAKARGIDVLLADTAGRLHTQSHLLQELQKIKRVLKKLDVEAPHDVLMVLDASIGQNALQQVRQFHETMGLTGLVITKLDGTAKAGVLFAIAQEFNLPCYFIGIGEGVNDLRPFEPQTFVQAILS